MRLSSASSPESSMRTPIPLVREQMLGPDYAGDDALLPHAVTAEKM
jgi:hypothetical protein